MSKTKPQYLNIISDGALAFVSDYNKEPNLVIVGRELYRALYCEAEGFSYSPMPRDFDIFQNCYLLRNMKVILSDNMKPDKFTIAYEQHTF